MWYNVSGPGEVGVQEGDNWTNDVQLVHSGAGAQFLYDDGKIYGIPSPTVFDSTQFRWDTSNYWSPADFSYVDYVDNLHLWTGQDEW